MHVISQKVNDLGSHTQCAAQSANLFVAEAVRPRSALSS